MRKDLFGKVEKNIKKNNSKNLGNKNNLAGNVVLPAKKELIEGLKLELKDYTKDIVIDKFLAEKKLELKKMQAQASIIIGKIFQEVKEKLGGKNQYDGVYVKWLEDVGTNKMTALRHRNRYNLFKICKEECGKLTIATLPTKLIQEIVKIKDGRRFDILRKIDDGATREEIEDLIGIDLLESKSEENEKDLVKKIDIYDFSDSEKLNNITDPNELKFYRSKHKEFKEILDKGNEILINKEIELSNKKNEFKTVASDV